MEINIEEIKSKKSIKELLEFGIINIDKSSGPTSFDTSDLVKKTLGLRKTSHFGTLDPKVTGVLPVALNRGCKLTGFFIGEDKEYVGIMRFHEDVPLEKIKKAIEEKFTGVIIQLPPVRSRVKRQHREREVKSFEIIEKEGKEILFHVVCQGGTYIRKLVHDLGEFLGVGAHMLELRRTRAGIFSENDEKYPSVNLFDFEKAVEEYGKGKEDLLREIIVPGEIVSELFPVVQLKEKYVDKVFHGSPMFHEYLKNESEEKLIEKENKFCAFSGDKFIGVFETDETDEKVFGKSKFVLQPL
jgi:H/ACA ribonucleoprotein complex subunit 4